MCSRIVTSNRENHFTSVIISTIISTMLRVLQAFLLFFFLLTLQIITRNIIGVNLIFLKE